MQKRETNSNILAYASVFVAALGVIAALGVTSACLAYADVGLQSTLVSTQSHASSTYKGKVLRVGFDAEWPPFSYIDDDGIYTGLDLELAQAVCKANKWKCQLEPIDWDAKDALLSMGGNRLRLERFRSGRPESRVLLDETLL